MKTWDEFTDDEKIQALLNEVHSLRSRLDYQAVCIGQLSRSLESLGLALQSYSQFNNIDRLAVNSLLMEKGIIGLKELNKRTQRATCVHDQFTAAMRDNQDPLRKVE